MKRALSPVIFMLILSALLPAAVSAKENPLSFQPRKDYGAPLEPAGRILHGAGQDSESYKTYSGLLADTPPVITMHYYNLKDSPEAFLDNLNRELLYFSERGICLIPQIGLQMTTDGTPGNHYEGRVAAGDHDNNLRKLLTGLKETGHPVFLRIGFEFNGLAWNGYEPESYKAAWIHITKMARELELEAATVWCAAIHSWVNPPTLDNARFQWMDYYPGDEWVDWWSIDTFDKSEFRTPPLKQFLKEADSHGKPVMIGESTPKGIGVKQGKTSWNAWFDPWFRMMADNPGIKAFCYISRDWSIYPQWQDWGDSRLQVNKVVRDNFAAALKDPVFFHGGIETVVRETVGVTRGPGGKVPAPLLSGSSDTAGGILLTWTWSGPEDSLLRFEILRNGTPVHSTTGTRWTDSGLTAGDECLYSVRAVSKSGGRSEPSGTVAIKAPPIMNKIRGGDFEADGGFFLRVFEGGEGVFRQVRKNGSGLGEVAVTKPTGTNWHIQLNHPLRVEPGRVYHLTAELSADKECTIQILYQKAGAPYTVYLHREEKIGPVTRRIVIRDFTFPASDDIFLAFMMGTLPVTVVRFDNIAVEESLP